MSRRLPKKSASPILSLSCAASPQCAAYLAYMHTHTHTHTHTGVGRPAARLGSRK